MKKKFLDIWIECEPLWYTMDPKYQKLAPNEKLHLALEKFAQSIVNECVNVSLESSLREDDKGANIARNIQEHFEVNDDN